MGTSSSRFFSGLVKCHAGAPESAKWQHQTFSRISAKSSLAASFGDGGELEPSFWSSVRMPIAIKDSSWGAKRRFFGVLHAHSRSPNSQFNDGERFVPLPSISGDVKVVRAETTRHLHVCAMKVRVAKPARMRDVDPSPLFHWFFYISKEVTSLKFIAVIQYGKNDRKIELHRDLAKIKIMNDLQKRPSA